MDKKKAIPEKLVNAFDKYKEEILGLPEAARADAILWMNGLRSSESDNKVRYIFDFMNQVWAVVEELPVGVRSTALRHLMRLRGDNFLRGKGGGALKRDLEWISSSVMPIKEIGSGAPRVMRAMLARRLGGLSRGDVIKIIISILGQAIAASIILVKQRTIGLEGVVVLEGLAVLLAGWLVAKCEGVDRDLWNDIMAGFTLFSILFPVVVHLT